MISIKTLYLIYHKWPGYSGFLQQALHVVTNDQVKQNMLHVVTNVQVKAVFSNKKCYM